MATKKDFITHWVYQISNSFWYEIELSSDGAEARIREKYDSWKIIISDWIEITYIDNEDTGETEPVIEFGKMNIPLSEVTKIPN